MLTASQIKKIWDHPLLGPRGDYVPAILPEFAIGVDPIKRIVLENIQRIKSYSDIALVILNNNERISGVDPVDGTRATDPVYRKISKAAKLAYNTDYIQRRGIAGIMADYVTQLQVKIEERKMTQEEYSHLYRTSMRELLLEWAGQIEERLKKTA